MSAASTTEAAPVEMDGARDVAGAVERRGAAVGPPAHVDDAQVGPADVLGEPLRRGDELGAGETCHWVLRAGGDGPGGRRRYDTDVVSPFMPEPAKVAAIRALLPATGAGIYLNAGTAGPMPAETQRAMDEQAQRELAVGRGLPDLLPEILERMAEARAAVAAVVVADPDDIALTHGVSDGLNLLVNALAVAGGRPRR